MKIRTRLTLLFASITAAILIAFACFVYLSSASDRENEFYRSLRQQALTKTNLVLEAKVDPKTLQTIYRSTKDFLYEEEIAVYDTAFNLVYHDAVDIDFVKETPEMIDEIVKNKEVQFRQDDRQVVGFTIRNSGTTYVVTAAAYDHDGIVKLHNLRNTLAFSLIGSMIVLYAAGVFYAGRALQPVSEMIDKVKEITATSLDLRVNTGNGKDEIAELASTFNRTLDRLENSFDSQKQFVSNISHELRTPLATIVAELELSLNRQRSTEEYKDVIRRALSDSQKLVKLSNSLLDLAKASYDQTEIAMKVLRLDELLLDARDVVLKGNNTYKVDIGFEQEIDNDNFISVTGNEYLLKVAFINLIENACKFSSDNNCVASIDYSDTKTFMRFSDHGLGISKRDLDHIFEPFYRGQNKRSANGNGIGLSLTQKIIQLHRGHISVESETGRGTAFTVELEHI